jgi:hypothetical protein
MNTPSASTLKKGSTIFLQAVIVGTGLAVLAFLLVEPHFEGRNVGATWSQVYFHDPFLAYAYAGSIAFFVALFEAFALLGQIRRNNVFSQAAVDALRTIKRCAAVLTGFILGAEAYFFLIQRGREDDIAGGVMMGLVFLFATTVVGTAAGVFEKTLQGAVDLKSENDLMV